jgi:hypothetical protein
MKLDIKARLLPKGYLINSEGAMSRKSNNGVFYCGRRVLTSVAFCDGYCGPTNGTACGSCKILS